VQALRAVGCEAVGPSAEPDRPGECVTLAGAVSPDHMVVHRIVLADGMGEAALRQAVSAFQRQLALAGSAERTGILVLAFSGTPPAAAAGVIRGADGGDERLYVGGYDAARGRFVVFNRSPAGWVAAQILDLYEGAAAQGRRPVETVGEHRQKMVRLVAARKPVVLMWGLLAASVVVFMAMSAKGGTKNLDTLLRFGANYGPAIGRGEVWRLFTAMFVHIGLLHILFNSYVLYVLGRDAEAFLGQWRFLVTYLGAGLTASIASVCMAGTRVSAGASGAIFGLGGALLAYALLNRRALPVRLFSHWVKNLLFFVVLNLMIGLMHKGIDNWAHGGGLVGGFLFGLCLVPLVGDGGRLRLRNLGALGLAAALALGVYGSVELNRDAKDTIGAAQEYIKLYNMAIMPAVRNVQQAGDLRQKVLSDQSLSREERLALCGRADALLDDAEGLLTRREPKHDGPRKAAREFRAVLEAERESMEAARAWVRAPTAENVARIKAAGEKAQQAADRFGATAGALIKEYGLKVEKEDEP
jgi:membrane associated rhomboid family serine protease